MSVKPVAIKDLVIYGRGRDLIRVWGGGQVPLDMCLN